MKKFLIVSVVCLASLLQTMAADANYPYRRHELQLSIGDFTPLNTDYSLEPVSYYTRDWFSNDCYGRFDFESPMVNLSYHYALFHWFQVGGQFSFQTSRGGIYEMPSDDKLGDLSRSFFYLGPSVRFTFINYRKFAMYSQVSMGMLLTLRNGYDPLENYLWGMEISETELSVFPQFSFVGLRFGNRLYGTLELGYGVKGIFNAGLGYRF